MIEPTQASEVFREIRELDELLLQLVASPDAVDWHWPGYYQLYVQVDRMGWSIQSAARAVGHTSSIIADAIPDGTHVAAANAALDALGKNYMAVLGWLWQHARGMSSVIKEPRLKAILRAHLHPKSGWYQACFAQYCAGRISPDGARLERTILLLEPSPPERIDQAVDETYLLRRQLFDIGAEDKRRALALASDEVQDMHARATDAMRRHLLAHCHIGDLAHPSSI
ncbi:hypothetical protein [Massilia sp.]|uniref:hypothetical protein n=1 Tax=Massilia sp. TaxID=1882437 RepID=UPI003919400A